MIASVFSSFSFQITDFYPVNADSYILLATESPDDGMFEFKNEKEKKAGG
jgi:hypothetical protein